MYVPNLVRVAFYNEFSSQIRTAYRVRFMLINRMTAVVLKSIIMVKFISQLYNFFGELIESFNDKKWTAIQQMT